MIPRAIQGSMRLSIRIYLLYIGVLIVALISLDLPFRDDSVHRRLMHRSHRAAVTPQGHLEIASTTTSHFFNTLLIEANSSSSIESKIAKIKRAGLGSHGKALPADAAPEDYYHNPEAFPMDDLVDIIITVEEEDVLVDVADSTKVTIPFLDGWRDVISSLHCIIVLAEGLDAVDPTGKRAAKGKNMLPGVPSWLSSYEIYSQEAIKKVWREKAYLAGRSGLSLRNFGFWISDRTVVYAIDKRSTPLEDNSGYRDTEGHRVVPPLLGGGSKAQIFARSKEQHKAHHHLLRGHLANLFTPSTPSYFNSYYDAYKPGQDFPTGYPYDYRDGTFTAISHGLSTGDAHYDVFTRYVKPRESHEGGERSSSGGGSAHRVTMSVPSGSLYSMAHNNVAINRRIIGAVFMYPPYLGADSKTPIFGDELTPEDVKENRDMVDVLSGWFTKVVCDHVGIGVKSGAPYVHRAFPPSSHGDAEGTQNAGIDDLLAQAKRPTLARNRRLFEFLQSLLPATLNFGDTKGNVAKGCPGNLFAMEYGELNMAVECAYLKLAENMQERLGVQSEKSKYKLAGVDALSEAMRDWLSLWHTRNTFIPRLHPVSTYSSEGPYSQRISRDKAQDQVEGRLILANGTGEGETLHASFAAAAASPSTVGGKVIEQQARLKSTCGVITIVRDEKDLLPIWLRYYSRHIPLPDMYILDHLTEDNSTHPGQLPGNINYRVLYGNTYAMPVVFRSWTINKYQDRLLRYGYKCVIFGDTDELIVPSPKEYPKGLEGYLTKFLADPKRLYHRVHALEVGHVSYGNGSDSTVEPPFDWNNPYILQQRKTYIPDHMYDKPLLTKIPLRYKAGFHKLFTRDKVEVDPDLVMLHMRSFDWDFCSYREEQKFNLSKLMKPEELASGMASHWRTYLKDKKTGELCRYAKSSFFGEQKEDTRYLDNTGRIAMQTFEPEWKSVMV